MNKDDFYYLGKVIKTFGNKGQLLVSLDVDDPQVYRRLESVFLDLHGERIPFFIDSMEPKQHRKAVIHFKDIDSIEDAEAFPGLEMYLPLNQLPLLKGKKFYFHEIIGFTVVDLRHGNIGKIENILEFPNQSLFQIRSGKKEILVPIVDEIIQRLDRKNKILEINAPDGLIEIYS
ncbi:MAG: ribosome maturation factor RimM [Bacteroidales bacterium]|jgi:16S rRNA processing protein RimM|nr:ribosome maturation factor RimM [Bacteroidales bacterium]